MDIGELIGKFDEILGGEICNGQDIIQGGMVMFLEIFCYRNVKKFMQDGLFGLLRFGVMVLFVRLYLVVMIFLLVDVRLQLSE